MSERFSNRPDLRRVGIRERFDSWMNAIVGWGGSKDKTAFTEYATAFEKLNDSRLTTMFATEDLSAKIVDVYPREAMRKGFRIASLESEEETRVTKYLRPWKITDTVLRGAIWGRLYGGSAIWMGNATVDPRMPLQLGERVDFLRVLDRRYLTVQHALNVDPSGRPIMYQVTTPDGRVPVGEIHASRLVVFPGALTDERTKISNGHWDLSVLQRPYNALRSDGSVWKAAEILISEASVGVTKIKGLFSLVAGKQKERLADRLQLLNLSRSVARGIVLDKDNEEFDRVQTTFAGVADLTDRSLKRIASAAEIPVTVLMGEAPAGLNATGDSDLRWFFARIDAYRTHALTDPIIQLLTVLLSAPESPLHPAEGELGVMWPELWTPSATERAEIYSKTATGDSIYLDRGLASNEEIALSRFTEDGYSQETKIDRELREPSEDGTFEAPGSSGEGTEESLGTTGKDENVQTKVLNGAQITAMIDVVARVANQEIPRESGVAILVASLQVESVEAEKIMGSAGQSFKPKEKEPPASAPGEPTPAPAKDEPPPPKE